MASTGLEGPYWLTSQTIKNNIKATAPGAYALGYLDATGGFVVEYVGRSDFNIAVRLQSWVDKGYPRFKFGYFPTAQQAFYKECVIYHDFGGSQKLNNEYHPDRPNNTNWQCPKCNIFQPSLHRI